MARNHVNVGRDHIQRLAKTNPLAAVEELIWNALDSGSKQVETILRMNDMGGVQDIEIIDYGSGISIDELEQAFGNLGESKKVKQKETIPKDSIQYRLSSIFFSIKIGKNPFLRGHSCIAFWYMSFGYWERDTHLTMMMSP